MLHVSIMLIHFELHVHVSNVLWRSIAQLANTPAIVSYDAKLAETSCKCQSTWER